jgi:hypothetical protein
VADHTAAEQLAAIDIVTNLLAADGKHIGSQVALDSLRRRITERANHDRDIGKAFKDRFGALVAGPVSADEFGRFIRAAVESTGATIAEPPRALPAEEANTDAR